MSIFRKSIFAVLALFSITSQANAALITDRIDFGVTGFGSVYGTPTDPTDPVNGSVNLTFDPSILTAPTTTGISLNSLNIPNSFPLGFKNDPTGGGSLVIGSFFSGGGGTVQLAGGTDSFYVQISGIATAFPHMFVMGYSRATPPPGSFVGDYWSTFYFPANSYVRVTKISGLSPVPLPAGLPMFGAAIIGLGLLRLYRRKGLSATA